MKRCIAITSFVICTIIFALMFTSIFVFPLRYQDYIILYAKKYDLNPALVASVINVESGYKKDSVSSAGAIGLMQIMPSTASEIASKLNIKEYDLSDTKTNIEFGCYYIRYLLNRYSNNVDLTLASYNAGPNNVDNWINGNIKFIDQTKLNIPFKETRNYVKKVHFNLFIYKMKYSYIKR